jgi:hypothetical protein
LRDTHTALFALSSLVLFTSRTPQVPQEWQQKWRD